jgi:hypothetical protein
MKFREHRGGLAESMETLVELPDRAALVAYCKKLLTDWQFDVKDNDVVVEQYTPNGDKRIGWDQLYIVSITGYGVMGFTDGPATHTI